MDRNEKQNSYRTPHVTRNGAGAANKKKKNGNGGKGLIIAAGILAVAILAGGGYAAWHAFGPQSDTDKKETSDTRSAAKKESAEEDVESATEFEPTTSADGMISGSEIAQETEGELILSEEFETEEAGEKKECALDEVLDDDAQYRLTSVSADGSTELIGQNCGDPADVTLASGEITNLLAVGTFYEKLGTGVPEDIDLGTLANAVLGKAQSGYSEQDRSALEDMICHIGAALEDENAADTESGQTEDIGSDENLKKGMTEIRDFVQKASLRAILPGELKDGSLDTALSLADLELYFTNLAGCGDWTVWTDSHRDALYTRTAEDAAETESELMRAIREAFEGSQIHWVESVSEHEAVMMIDGENGAHWFFGIQGSEDYSDATAGEIAQALVTSVNGG